MNVLFQGNEFSRVYTEDLLILGKWDCTDNVHKLEITLNNTKESGFKWNIEKYFSGKTEMEYLCLCVTRDGVKQTDKKYRQ